MIQIAICDDNKFERKNIEDLLHKFFLLHPEINFCVHTFPSASELLSFIEKKEIYNIYLLDIIMPEHDGISIGEKIRERDSSAIIIYLSSSPDYALKAFHVYAFQYLLKPLVTEKLFSTLEKAISNLKQAYGEYFVIKTKEGLVSLSCLCIEYIEYFNHIIYIYMKDGAIYESVTLRESFDKTIKELLQYPFFVKPHKSFLVNLNAVKKLQEHSFLMNNASFVPISRNNYSNMKKIFIEFLSKEKGS